MSGKQPDWAEVRSDVARIREQVGRIVVGQQHVVEMMLVALLCKGHCLVVGVPGLAKTLLVSSLGRILGLKFRRIQFTPDLMPMDILGSEILQEDAQSGRRQFEFVPGPIFANLVLADEINRTPPKTQAALLEAMQEKQVTVAGRTMPLGEPFIVYATQNPIEHEGTYPLPEAQLDRFLFSLNISYPSMEEEREVVLRTTGSSLAEPEAVLTPEGVIQLQRAVPEVPLADHVLDYVLRLVHATRPDSPHADDRIRRYVAWGAGPRASQSLVQAARAAALLAGQPAASIEDVKRVAPDVLRHRLIPNYNATGEGVSVESLVEHLLANV